MFKYSKTATFFWFLIIDSIVLCENITAGANDEGTLIFAQIVSKMESKSVQMESVILKV